MHWITALALIVWADTAWGQEPLVGTWVSTTQDDDGTFTAKLSLRADSTAVISFEADYGTDAFADDEIPDGVFPETFVVGFEGAGTWRTDNDLLFLELDQRSLSVNDEPYVDAVNDIGEALALSLVEELEIAEEDVPAFVQLVQEGLREDLNEEALLSEFLALLDEGVEYTVVGDLMTTVDTETGELDLWTRVEETVIAGVSWATIKKGTLWTR